jgi:hypothetical protein
MVVPPSPSFTHTPKRIGRHAPVREKPKTPALAIRLRGFASFREKIASIRRQIRSELPEPGGVKRALQKAERRPKAPFEVP